MPYRAPACPEPFCHFPMLTISGEDELDGAPPFYICDNCGVVYTVESGDLPGRKVCGTFEEEESRARVARDVIDRWNAGAWEEIPGIGWWYRGKSDIPDNIT